MSSPGEVMRSDLRMSPSSEQLYAFDYYRHHHNQSSIEPSSSYSVSPSFYIPHQNIYDHISSSPQPAQHHDSNLMIDQDWTWKWSDRAHEDDNVVDDDWAFVSRTAKMPQSSIHPSDTEISQEHSFASQMMPSLASTTGSQSPSSNLLTSQPSPHTSIDLDGDGEEEASEDDEVILEGRDPETTTNKKKVQRRQGVTCDQCRSKHVRCIAREEDQHSIQSKEQRQHPQKRCERCHEKNLDCTRNYSPPSRRYPRPSRTGKRIEQARMIHGTLSEQSSSAPIWYSRLSPEMLMQARPKLFIHSNPTSDSSIANRIMAGSVSLRLLTCFFATAHMQMPIVDFHNFSARYNFAQGNCRTMSIMANGGDSSKEIPSAKQSAPGLASSFWPPDAKTKTGRNSALSTPGTTEALIAVMHAWAALYTDIPVAFGGSTTIMLSQDDSGSLDLGKMEASPDAMFQGGQTTPASDYIMGANGKLRRAKRKSGVACDTCRLRRLRCDKLERPEGLGCSRCEDKRIVCTDEYIQFKKKKTESNKVIGKSSKTNQEGDAEVVDGMVGSAPSIAKDVSDSYTNADSIQQRSWITQGLQLSGQYQFGKSREALAFGKARQPFFQSLLEKAINLVVKHQLMIQPSVEGIQALMLLAQIVDLAKHRKGDIFAEAAANHIASLGLESNYEVDETDRKAVEQILGHMQRRRLWCCVWTRDAIVSGLYRRSPRFVPERAFCIRGSRTVSVTEQQTLPEDATGQMQCETQVSASQSPSETSSGREGNNADLNGEMGLSFSILALMQVGALSRFMARHVDNATLSMEYGTLDAASVYEMRKMTKACQALWKSIDSLLSFFDQCSLTARHNMDQLQPFQPLGWIATIKIAGAMLDLATFRNLAERLQRAILIYSPSDPKQMHQQQHPLVELKMLVEESRKRTLNSCRRIAKLVEFLLDKNVFQTSGIILRQLLPVTQFLVKMPCEVLDPLSTHLSAARSMPSSDGGPREVIDPREIFMNAQPVNTSAALVETQDNLRRGHIPEFIFSTRLEPFDAIQKRREVDHCLEALAQMGYAWPTMDVEISYLEKMMEGSHL